MILFEKMCLKERLVFSIENTVDISDERSDFHSHVSFDEYEYELKVTICRTFEKQYGGSDDYGSREEFYTLKTQECVVEGLTRWNENGEPLCFTESQELSDLADYIEDYFTVKN